MPAFAFMMLLIWPVVTAVIFSRMDKQAALVCTILLGYLILPPLVEIDLPLVPGIGKPMVPALSAALFTRFRSRADNPFGERLLAALRNQFGGHAVTRAAGGSGSRER